ncbi:MAG: phosphatidylglycerophosphatase A family protein [Gammaproteobacteria bacterium]
MRLSSNWILAPATLGVGYSPVAPGTLGTLLALPFAYWLQALSVPVQTMLIVLAIPACIAVCHQAEKLLQQTDSSKIVLDEFIAMLACCIALPTGWQWLFLSFVLFRLLDILKPWPISWVERNLKGGAGVVSDDLMAAGICWLAIQITAHLTAGL